MPFSLDVVTRAWERAKHRCERCGKLLSWENRGREGWGKWEAHSRSGRHLDSPTDCRILCWDCHKTTF